MPAKNQKITTAEGAVLKDGRTINSLFCDSGVIDKDVVQNLSMTMTPETTNDDDDELSQTLYLQYEDVEGAGGECCDCCGAYCVCRPCECMWRICCFLSGCDLQCNQCQFWCWRCYCCPTDTQKQESLM